MKVTICTNCSKTGNKYAFKDNKEVCPICGGKLELKESINENSACNEVLAFFGYIKKPVGFKSCVNIYKNNEMILKAVRVSEVWQYLKANHKW